ncbi:AMP-binding protein [Tomitella gaofuii]|uniref:AMP-binding protein n=1 Tax=Tomitella gaofuii TaxID=2760083 RepID=UPI0015FCBE00|nr:AMP-binding protein [Tomitella gaofuii]
MPVRSAAESADTLESALARVQALQQKNWPSEVPRSVDYPAGTDGVVDYLRHWAAVKPDHPAIVFYGRTVTYAELDELTDRFAGWLATVGAQPGDRVGVHLPNCPQFTVAMMGILKAGAVHVPVNPLFREHELRHELIDAGVTVLLTGDTSAPLVEKVRADTPVRHVATTNLADMLDAAPVPAAPFPHPSPEDSDWDVIVGANRAPARPTDPHVLAALNYTGGTTGLPKGCEHTQWHMLYTAATAAVGDGMQPGTKDLRVVSFLPVFWIAGEDLGILCPLVNGGTAILLTRWDADAVLEVAARHGATDMVGTVDNYLELLEHPGFDGAALAGLTNPKAVSFVTKLSPEIRARWRDATGQTLREASYGMTETHTVDTFTLGFQDDDADLHSEPVFCGLPMPGTDIVLVDGDGRPVPIGEEGEILLRSPSVLTGYFGRPDATADAIVDGWLHTGDVGRFDERGALHYLARAKEMIKINGMSVFPAEVEALLLMHPDVESAAVVPRPDARRGQVPAAFVTLAPGAQLTPDDAGAAGLRAWAAENMAGYKVPEVTVLDALPMTATGKVRKGDLFERVQKES